jgi:hypothetical protein
MLALSRYLGFPLNSRPTVEHDIIDNRERKRLPDGGLR